MVTLSSEEIMVLIFGMQFYKHAHTYLWKIEILFIIENRYLTEQIIGKFILFDAVLYISTSKRTLAEGA